MPSQKPPAQPEQGHPTHKPGERAPFPPGQPPPTGLPPITDEDRRAAFPELNGQHTVHDNAIFTYVLFDQLEWQSGDGGSGLSWDNKGWIGGDINRFWFRTEGEGEDGDLDDAQAHALYGRAIARWWDLESMTDAELRRMVGSGPVCRFAYSAGEAAVAAATGPGAEESRGVIKLHGRLVPMAVRYETLAGEGFELSRDDVRVVAAPYEGSADNEARGAEAHLQIGKELEAGYDGFYECTL